MALLFFLKFCDFRGRYTLQIQLIHVFILKKSLLAGNSDMGLMFFKNKKSVFTGKNSRNILDFLQLSALFQTFTQSAHAKQKQLLARGFLSKFRGGGQANSSKSALQ